MRKILFTAALCSFLLCLWGGYRLTLRIGNRDITRDSMEVMGVGTERPVIHEDTMIVYQHFYNYDKGIKEWSEHAPLFLQGLGMEQLKSVYRNWQVMLFSPEKVILRYYIDGISSESYLLGDYNGFLAVYYEDEYRELHLKEVTEVPISALPEEEIKKLKAGIRITGETELAELLGELTS